MRKTTHHHHPHQHGTSVIVQNDLLLIQILPFGTAIDDDNTSKSSNIRSIPSINFLEQIQYQRNRRNRPITTIHPTIPICPPTFAADFTTTTTTTIFTTLHPTIPISTPTFTSTSTASPTSKLPTHCCITS